jgi:hypothetical protein
MVVAVITVAERQLSLAQVEVFHLVASSLKLGP